MKKIFILLALIIVVGLFISRRKKANDNLENQTPNSMPENNEAKMTQNQKNNLSSKEEDRSVASTQQNSSESFKSEEELLEYLKSEGSGNWKFIRNSEGKVMTVSGGNMPSVGKNSSSALEFAKKIAPFFQVESAQVVIRKDGKSFSQTGRSKIYRFEQKINNYEVYGAGITLMTSKNDDSAYMITTDLKEVKGLSFKTAESTTALDFKDVVLNEFSSEERMKIKRIEPKPVIWANSEPAELAWVYLVETWDKKFQKIKVLVGAESGKVLTKEKISFN
jgi:hypothetical protein